MKKKKVTVVLSLGAAALLLIGGISVYAHQTSDSGESETVYKETTAEYGTLTVGITESGGRGSVCFSRTAGKSGRCTVKADR